MPMPIVTHMPDVLSPPAGLVQDARSVADALVSWLKRNKQIDTDVWRKLRDVANGIYDTTDEVMCAKCWNRGHVVIGRSQGFENPLCEDCERMR